MSAYSRTVTESQLVPNSFFRVVGSCVCVNVRALYVVSIVEIQDTYKNSLFRCLLIHVGVLIKCRTFGATFRRTGELRLSLLLPVGQCTLIYRMWTSAVTEHCTGSE